MVNETIKNSFTKQDAANVLINLFEQNDNLKSLIDKDFLSQIEINEPTIVEVDKIVKRGFILRLLELGLQYHLKLKFF